MERRSGQAERIDVRPAACGRQDPIEVLFIDPVIATRTKHSTPLPLRRNARSLIDSVRGSSPANIRAPASAAPGR